MKQVGDTRRHIPTGSPSPCAFFSFLLPQTVEAMQAILDDLTIDDNFSIIDFNHNVRCWSEELVQGSSIQIADAKKYIQSIKPNGGLRTFSLFFSRSSLVDLMTSLTRVASDPRHQHQRGPDESGSHAGEGVQPGGHRPSLHLHDHSGVRRRPHRW